MLVVSAASVWLGCAGPVPSLAPREPTQPTVTIHVVGHGWHTGIVFRRDDIPETSWPEHARFPAARFLEAGWGDRAFYETPDAGVWLALKAAFGSEASVLHVAGFDRPPAAHFPAAELVAIDLPAPSYAALARFVSATYARGAAGSPVELGPGLFPLSRFYAATRPYSLSYTCNSWVAEALHAAGCPVASPWPVTAGGLLREARRCAEPRASSPKLTLVPNGRLVTI